MPPKEFWEAYSNRTVRPSRFVSGAFILYSLNTVRNPKYWCVDASWGGGVSHTTFWLL